MTRWGSLGLVVATVWALVLPATASTLEAVKKEIHDKVSKYRSIRYTLKSRSELEAIQITSNSEVEVKSEYLRKGDKVLSRVETHSKGHQKIGAEEKDAEMTIVTIDDGRFNYTVTETKTERHAVKTLSGVGVGASPMNPMAVFKQAERIFDTKLLPDETVDGKPVYVIEMTPKTDALKRRVGRTLSYYDKKTGLSIKTLVYNGLGTVMTTTIMTDIRINGDLSPDRFVFKPPAGVTVVDATSRSNAGGRRPGN